ncbi:tripartite tricarboxylate transporter substrate binding protein [Bordetella bronchiseptica]|uniref:Exported protein n=4 Tax=Bordetella TaxID=517 RepID=K0MIR5_BORPB|nr:tripartite tricarboxylate transporter substrate binding protein [Bordetella bronchiseptica]CAE35837.1 putative exported protein [Bordetella bronchiseptica RB50]CCJ50709.1 putative exported protein [Bordetella parapertussis Bpp5]CCJ56466.1 putative exported protein [Bordetella bronchiseptica 253]CCN24423.1 putative exported protein [Bordetella bronchiseptica 1289]
MAFFNEEQRGNTMQHTLAKYLAAAAVAVLPWTAGAQDKAAKPWQPDGPVTLILGYGAGGGHYALAQVLQARMAEELGQPLIVMPKPGAGGLIATDFVANARPDGRTITWSGPGVLTIWPQLRQISYDPKKLTPVNLLVQMGYMLVTKPGESRWNSVQDVIDGSKSGDVTYSSVGVGTSNSMTGHLLNAMTGSRLREIGYKGGGPALMSTMAGETDIGFGDTATHELIAAGRLRAIATTTRQREPRFPDVPTVAETVPGYEVTNWLGVIAPPGTPQPIVDRYQQIFAKLMAEPEIAKRVKELGMTPDVGTPQAFSELIDSETQLWKRLIRDQNIKVE